ncbi:glycine--tRNA ligase subunit beta [Persicimonas caeni]|uniref:Glycine--tRNA ligase beta subunit n=1 Tax=Persicimonas caeni TaxID=2292766 RepID=A0A4Y6PRY7_PERCE|nr:glycine--tRNA ligase subunit beta [Persicimonas caeni]QDG50879.1 glycine--tRNA ligase subunit beta [Persicimonas caeni]QED32100.1 glycine--tRNA ligase subunit beta [Persicimonas caeni]
MQLIFEIGAEELPASFCEPALTQIEQKFRERADELRISFDSARTVSTPRRLTLLVDGLAEKQSDLEEERTGPPANIAFKDGEPTKAAEGFARGQGVDVSDLYTVDTDKGEYIAAKVFEEGQPTAELLPELLEEIINGLGFPKSMRWADRTERFARPVRWILAVAGGETVPVTYAGVESSNTTRGHRFAAPESFEVSSIDDYLDGLREAHVIADPAERRETIEKRLAEIAEDIGGTLVQDPALVDEVAFLIEEPHAIAIKFGDEYLELPDEVLISSMRSHQRYFSIADEEGDSLISVCGVIYNTPVRTPEQVYDGNLRVLKARLDDARFFWDKDLKTPLDALVDKLDDVVWLKKLGSMKDRSERMSKLAGAIANELGLGEHVHTAAERGALLSKADLLTDMVGEFPDLQGVMGREYALAHDEDADVAHAIYEQYLPKGAEDDTPATPAGAAVALAEKIDALTGTFGIGLIPTSTSDPYALRRAALGVIRILQEREYSIGLSRLFELSVETYEELSPGVLEKDHAELVDEVVDFAATRLKYQLTDEYPTDVVDAVLAANKDDVLSVQDRVAALAELRDEPDFEPLAIGFKRVVNILRKQAEEQAELAESVDAELLEEEQERALHEAWQEAAGEVDSALAERDWRRACGTLIGLKAPVDDFFDNVMVMAEDEKLRQNRIALLDELRELFMKVADISKIQA